VTGARTTWAMRVMVASAKRPPKGRVRGKGITKGSVASSTHAATGHAVAERGWGSCWRGRTSKPVEGASRQLRLLFRGYGCLAYERSNHNCAEGWRNPFSQACIEQDKSRPEAQPYLDKTGEPAIRRKHSYSASVASRLDCIVGRPRGNEGAFSALGHDPTGK
jgi:hypothetical protein